MSLPAFAHAQHQRGRSHTPFANPQHQQRWGLRAFAHAQHQQGRIGLGQLSVLDERVRQRRANFEFYRAALSHLPSITFQPELTGLFSNRWLTTILIDPSKSRGVTREDIRLALEKENIESRPLWKPMHLQPVFQPFPSYGGGVSEKLFEQGLCLPSGSALTEEELRRVTTLISHFFS